MNADSQDGLDLMRPSTAGSSNGQWSAKRIDIWVLTNEQEVKTKSPNPRPLWSRPKTSVPHSARSSGRATSRSLPPRSAPRSISNDLNKRPKTVATRASSVDSQTTIIQDIEDSSDKGRKTTESSGKGTDFQPVKSKFMDGWKTDQSKRKPYTKPTSKWDEVVVSKHDPVKEDYSGVRSRFMDALLKKQVNRPEQRN